MCHAYECRFSQVCPEASPRPHYLPKQRCMNYWPEHLKPPAHLSNLVLDLLATYLKQGVRLSQGVRELLGRVRPDGPLRRVSVSVHHGVIGRRRSDGTTASLPSNLGVGRGSFLDGDNRWPLG